MLKFVLIILIASVPLCAQSVTGQIVDPKGAAVGGARIRLFSKDATQPAVTRSDAEGKYRFAAGAGSYLLEVEAEGFRRQSKELAVTADASVNIELELAGINSSVVVTAESSAQTLDEIAKAVTVIDRGEIRDRNEYALFETLRHVPGIQVRNQGGPGQFTQVRIRGLRPDAAQILIDGMRFRDASTIQGDASSFTPAFNLINLSRIEVLRGSGASLYGTGAVGGSVNLVTDPGGAPMHGELQAEGGGLGFLRGRAALSGGAARNRLIYSAGFQHINVTAGVDGDDRNRSTGGQGYVRIDATPRVAMWNRFYGNDDFGQVNISAATTGIPAGNFPNTQIVRAILLPPDQVRELNAGRPANYGNATLVPGRNDPDNHRDSTFYSNLTGVRFQATPRVAAQATYQRLNTERVFANGPAGFGFQPVGAATESNPRGTIDTLDARVSVQPIRALAFVGGYEFEREVFRDLQNNNQPGNARILARARVAQRSNAGYGQAQIRLLQERLQINLSGRVQDFALLRPEFEVTGTVNSYANFQAQAPPRAVTGDASIAYFAAASGTKFRAHVGNSYRAPSLYERFGGGFFANPATGAVGFTPYGDPRLAPDRYVSFDWGVDQYLLKQKVRISATHFYTRIKNATAFDFSGLINPATDPFGRSSGYIAGAGGISRGFELGIEARPTRTTTITGSYTYTNIDNDRDLVITGFFKGLNVPPHAGSFAVMQRIGKRFDVAFDLFRSSHYYINYFAAGRNRAFDFDGYTKADLVAGYRIFQGEKRMVKLYGKFENVFDRRYYENGVLNPGFWGLAGLTYSF